MSIRSQHSASDSFRWVDELSRYDGDVCGWEMELGETSNMLDELDIVGDDEDEAFDGREWRRSCVEKGVVFKCALMFDVA